MSALRLRPRAGSLKDLVGRALDGIGGGPASANASAADPFRNASGNELMGELPPELKEEEYFRFGDLISLFSDEAFGFMAADGLVDASIFLAEGEDGDQSIPSNFKDCVFRIDPVNNYAMLKAYKKRKEATVDTNDPTAQAYLRQQQIKMEAEQQQNIKERERTAGTPILYGQAVQLTHTKSKKYLTVARESAEQQKDCMRIMLDPVGNTGSYFYILPVYKIRSEGDYVRVGDQVLLFSRKFGQYIHASLEHRYPRNNKLEVNISTSTTRWRLNQFAPYQGVDSSLYLNAGDVISLYHREIEGHLSATDLGEVYIHVKGKRDKGGGGSGSGSGSGSGGSAAKQSSSYLWEIEMEDPSKGGIASWNTAFRFRHLATGRYLCAGKNAPTTTTTTTRGPQPQQSQSQGNGDPRDNNSGTAAANGNSNSSSAATTTTTTTATAITTTSFAPRSLGATLLANNSGNVLRDLQRKRSDLKNKWGLIHGTLGIFGNGSPAGAGDNDACDYDDGPSICELYTTETASHATLFVIHPPSKKEGFIWAQANVRLRHQSTNTWIHSLRTWIPASEIANRKKNKGEYLEYDDDQDSGIMAMADLDESMGAVAMMGEKYYKLNTNASMFEEDIFSIELANDDDIDRLNFVQSVVPVFQAFLNKVRAGAELRSSDAKSLIKAVTSLIIFCTEDTDEMDPLLREGSPIEANQNILLERRVIDLVMDVLREPFDRFYLALDKLELPEYADYQRLFTLCYRLVRHFLRSNKESGLYMSQYIRFIQTQIGYRLNAEDTLMELFKDNYELLQQITAEQIFFFIDIIAKTGKQPRYITFLSALCSCEGKSVTKNQDSIVELLLENTNNLKEFLILPYMEEDGTIYVTFKDNNHVQHKLDLKTFGTQFKDTEYVSYFENTIGLMAKLCEGRNKRASTIITELISATLLLTAIKDEELPPTLRTSFVILFMNAYVDNEPFQRGPTVIYTRMWESLDKKKKNANDSDAAIPANARASTMLPAEQISNLQSIIKELKEFFVDYYRANRFQDSQYMAKNQLMLQMTILCRYLFEFGFYTEVKEIKKIIHVLIGVLDGRDDKCGERPNAKPDARYEKTINNSVVHQTKIEVLKILNFICDFRLNDRITNYLSYFKHQYTNNLLNDANQNEHDDAANEEEAEMFEKLFGAKRLSFDSGQMSINVVLLDLMLYKNEELQGAALHLLFRNSSQKEELDYAMKQVEILVSDEMIRAYNKTYGILNNLRTRIHARMKGQAELDAVRYLDTLVKDTYKSLATGQRILRNLQAHKLVIDILYMLPYDPNSKADQASRKELLKLCYQLLTLFVKDNPTNQKLVFPHMSLILSNIGDGLGVAQCAQEIVAGNRELCGSIEEKHIRTFVNAIAEKGKYARYLRFLRSIVFVDGKSHKDNQTAVLKALMEREKDVMVLFKDVEGLRKRDLLMKQREHEKNPEESLLYYHVILLDLLAACAEGKNHVTEVKLQALISVEELTKQLSAKNCIEFVRDALLLFIDEVYINTRKKCREIETTEVIWTLFKKFNSDITNYIAVTKADPAASAKDNQYIFNRVLPSVRHYFDIYCPDEPELHIRREHINMLVQMAEQIIDLFYITANTSQRESAFRTVKGIHDKGIGTDRDKITQFVKKSMSNIRIPAVHGAMERSRLATIASGGVGVGVGFGVGSGSIISQQGTSGNGSETARMRSYAKSLQRKQNSEMELIRVFERYTAQVRKRVLAASDLDTIVEEFSKQDRMYLKHLVKILTRIANDIRKSGLGRGEANTVSGEGSTFSPAVAEHELNVHLAVSALGVLRKMITRYIDENDSEGVQAVQVRLNNCGVSKMLLDMVCTSNDEIVRASLALGIALLQGGNSYVQRKIYKTFQKTKSEGFFLELKRRIAKSQSEIKERRLFTMKKGTNALDSKKASAAALQELKGGAFSLVRQAQGNALDEDIDEQQVTQFARPPSTAAATATATATATTTTADVASASADAEFSERGFIRDILRFLQLLCEGHYTAMQNFLREQTNASTSSTSVNLIQEIIDYLTALQRYIDISNIHIAKQIFVTLTELVQGPCEANQIDMALRSKLLFVCSEILMDPLPSLGLPDVYDLKNEVLLTLISILEGNKDPRVSEAMRVALKPKRLEEQMADIRQKLQDNDLFHSHVQTLFMDEGSIRINNNNNNDTNRAKQKQKQKQEIIEALRAKMEELGIRYHFLISILQDSSNAAGFKDNTITAATTYGGGSGIATRQQQQKQNKKLLGIFPRRRRNNNNNNKYYTTTVADSEDEIDTFKEQTGRIEIVRDGVMERVYFKIPTLCKYLTKKTRDRFVRTVNRNDGPPGKIEDLVKHIPYFLREMEHQEKLSTWRFSFIQKQWANIKLFSFLISIIINIFVIFTFTRTFDARGSDFGQIPIPGVTRAVDENGNRIPVPTEGNYRFQQFDYYVFVLGVLQLIIIACLGVAYIPEFGVMTIVKHWKPEIPLDMQFSDLPRNFLFYAKCALYLLLYDHYLWFLLIYFVFSVLGFVYNPLFYSAHLLEVVIRFATLFSVLESIYKNVRTLALTGLLNVVVIFIFSNVVFTFFNDYFFVDTIDGSRHFMCSDVFTCLTNILNYGVRGGGFWEDVMAPNPQPGRMIFDLMFLFVVVVILVNIVFGAVLDTFGKLREEQNRIAEDIKSRCFICHIESQVFDRKANEGISFKEHIKNDHNMWNYVYFLIYLYRKDRTEYTGTEQYVADKIANREWSFFPAHRSLVLEESEERAALARLEAGAHHHHHHHHVRTLTSATTTTTSDNNTGTGDNGSSGGCRGGDGNGNAGGGGGGGDAASNKKAFLIKKSTANIYVYY